MVTLIFVRHGESEGNIGLPTKRGFSEIPLTAKGERQAVLAAAAVPAPSRIVVSPFLRARQTASPLIARHPGVYDVTTMPIQEFTYLDPTRCLGTTPAERKHLVEAYWKASDPEWRDGGGAESFSDLIARVESFLDYAAGLPGTTVAVSHRIFMTAVLHQVLRGHPLPTSASMRQYDALYHAFDIQNCAILKLELTRHGWATAGLSTSHLEKEGKIP